MVNDQERKAELPGDEPRAFGLPCQCSALELQSIPSDSQL